MSEMPGVMCRMPPYPVSVNINEENLNSVFQLNRMVSSFFHVQYLTQVKLEDRPLYFLSLSFFLFYYFFICFDSHY